MTYRFGVFELDKQTRTLVSNGEVVELTPKIYALLVLLVEAKGQVVTKEEIYQKVWSNRVVSDTTVYKVVEKVRVLLNDDKEQPKYIKTIHGEGYQFCYQEPLRKDKKSIYLTVSAVLAMLLLFTFFWGKSLNPKKPLSFNKINLGFVINKANKNIFIEGFQKFSQELLFSHFSNYKRHHKLTKTPTNGVLDVSHKLKKQGSIFLLDVSIQQKEKVISHKQIKANSEEKLLSEYLDFWRNNTVVSGELIDSLLKSEFSISEDLVFHFINGLGYFGRQKNQKANEIFAFVNEQDPGFLWSQIYHSRASRRVVDLSSSLGVLTQINNSQMSDYLFMIFHRVAAFSHLTVGNYNEAKVLFLTTLALAKEQNKLESIILTNVGFYKLALYQFDFVQAKKFLNRAQTLAEGFGNELMITNINKNFCEYHKVRSEIKKAVDFCEQALDGYIKQQKIVFQMTVHLRLSELYVSMNNQKIAQEHTQQALKISSDINNHNGMNRALKQKIRMALNERQYEKGLAYYEEFEANVFRKDHASTNKYLYLTKFWLEESQGDVESAALYLEKYSRYFSEKNMTTFYPFLKTQIKFLIKHKHQPEKAKRLLEEALTYRDKKEDPELVLYSAQVHNSAEEKATILNARNKAEKIGLVQVKNALDVLLEKVVF